ncbi:hypothetical protein [Pedobacter sp. Leaf170]|uniref:hypothetical protein n=1 Tax=Pedobacter sp. Leaf170 TaxID=2876558 RepID=UPI001E30E5A4|nr:hypothetical protein [Pedobacter sp. Leaf170]
MNTTQTADLRKAFLIYKNTVTSTLNNTTFYRSFLQLSVERYQQQEYQPDQIFSSVFHAYNISSNQGDGYSRMYIESDHFYTHELQESSIAFIASYQILSLLKIYNAMEIFVFQAIQIRFFPELKSPTGSRINTYKLTRAIEKSLTNLGVEFDTKNNRYLLSFLKAMSPEITWFLAEKVRIDLTPTYETFFDLVSILRNLVGHHGTIVSTDTKNEILSKAKDVFQRHFSLIRDQDGYENLQPKVDQFSNFISFYNELTVNIVKFIFGYEDLDLFDMY